MLFVPVLSLVLLCVCSMNDDLPADNLQPAYDSLATAVSGECVIFTQIHIRL